MSFIAHYVLTIAQLLLYCIFAHVFLKDFRADKRPALLFLLIAPFITYVVNSLGISWLNLLMAVCIATATLMLVFKEGFKKAIVIGVGVTVANVFCELFTLFIGSILLGADTDKIVSENITGVVFSAISTTLLFILVWLLRAVVYYRARKGSPVHFASNIRSITLPMAGVIVGYYVLFSNRSQTSISLSVFGLVVFACLLISIIINLFGTESDYRKYQIQKELEAMLLKGNLTTELIQMQQNSIEKLKAQSHDFKNHLICVQELTRASGKMLDDKTEAYLVQLMDDLDKAITTAYSNIENDALRVIVSKVAERCATSSIRFSTDMQYSDFAFMSYKDICSLFSNALDNAVYACEQIQDAQLQKYVSLSIRIYGQTIQIKLENSKSNPIHSHGSKLISAKPQAQEHGFGTKNIGRIAKAYGGYVSIRHADNEFILYIGLPIPE